MLTVPNQITVIGIIYFCSFTNDYFHLEKIMLKVTIMSVWDRYHNIETCFIKKYLIYILYIYISFY